MQIIHTIVAVIGICLSSVSMLGQQIGYRQTLPVSIASPVVLDIAVAKGDVTIGYSRDGEVSISASAKDVAGQYVSAEHLKTGLVIEQYENHILIRESLATAAELKFNISYRIDVPFQTQVNSFVAGHGNQKLIGIAGPAKLSSGIGDIEATLVRFAWIEAITGKGNISCSRSAQVVAETGAGNITLMEDGPSKAAVKKGIGRIEVGGVRGRFEGATDLGELHIKAILNDDWSLTSAAGNIRIEVPPKAKFRLDASTLAGRIYVEHSAMEKPPEDARQLRQEVNGGGKSIQARSNNGNIFIQ